MKSSIYIAAERIQIIGYSKSGSEIRIKEYLSASLPEGIIINGKIIDSGELTEILKGLKIKNPDLFKKAALVIDSNSLIVKKIAVPYLKKKQYYQLVKEELGGSAEITENLVFDYSFMSSNKEERTAILACGTEKSILESYLTVFNEAGIKLTSMWIGLQAIINFVKLKKELSEQTFVLNIIDGVSMLSVIFENGNYIFSTRTRLMGETEDQYLINIMENLSPLIQFNKSQKFADIEASYYLGLDENQVKFIDSISNYQNIDVALLDIYSKTTDAEKILDLCHFALLGIANDKKSINLISSYENANKHKVEAKQISPWTVTSIVFVLILLGIFIFPVARTLMLNRNIEIARLYIEDPQIVFKSNEIAEIITKTEKYVDIIRQRDEKKAEIDNKTSVDGKILDKITESYSEKVTISSISYEEEKGVLHVVGSSATENDSSDYVNILKQSELIAAVSYTGYSYADARSEIDNSKKFNFAIDVLLKGKISGGVSQ